MNIKFYFGKGKLKMRCCPSVQENQTYHPGTAVTIGTSLAIDTFLTNKPTIHTGSTLDTMLMAHCNKRQVGTSLLVVVALDKQNSLDHRLKNHSLQWAGRVLFDMVTADNNPSTMEKTVEPALDIGSRLGALHMRSLPVDMITSMLKLGTLTMAPLMIDMMMAPALMIHTA